MKNLDDYIVVFDNVLDETACEILIDTYNKSPNHIQERNNNLMKFREINIFKAKPFESFRELFLMKAKNLAESYRDYTGAFWPEDLAYEAPRIKKYEPNVGYFNWHIDSATAETGKRLLVMFWYLNDVEEGGETEFSIGEDIIKNPAKRGSVVCFPPNFLYPHRGVMPISSPKYVISSYVQLPPKK